MVASEVFMECANQYYGSFQQSNTYDEIWTMCKSLSGSPWLSTTGCIPANHHLGSCKDGMNDFRAFHPSQPEIEPLVAVGKPFVIHPQQMEQGRV